ncbi:MAG: translation initiation factor IF-2 [Deltaproteobacteria bacterium]|nr:translation initiation factor IF-2 [Deltaproteobacteria bacterium]
MGKRVYELAKELGVESRNIVLRLKEAGIVVKDHLAILTSDEEDKARKLFASPAAGEVVVKRIGGGRVVRRRVSSGARAVAVQPPPVKDDESQKAPEKVGDKKQETTEDAAKAAAAVDAKTADQEASAEVRTEVAAETPAKADKQEAAGDDAGKAAKTKQTVSEEPLKRKTETVPTETAEKKGKTKRLIYDRRRDVISLRDLMINSDDEPERFRRRRRAPMRRRRNVQRGRKPKQTNVTLPSEQKRNIRVDGETIQVGDMAKRMGLKANVLVKKLMEMGVMVSITQPIDLDTAGVVAGEFGFTVEKVGFDPAAHLIEVEDDEKSLKARPPVVTIMGHVDHGKTTLLDRIRKAHVAEGEAGGITQHIGAYKVSLPDGDIVFLDTPGHEAFTAMRARGAEVTDIVILIVAADDGVKAQTEEAIAHARDSGAPVIVAINKIDKPGANVERVRNELSEHGLIAEEWGGENIFCEISAKQGDGIDNLLEMILLQAQVLELKANPDKAGRGFVLEARLDRQLGPLATVLVRAGTLRIGDVVVAGLAHGRIRMLMDEAGNSVEEARPVTPVQVAGLDIVPNAGDQFVVLPDERKAKEVADWQITQIKKARSARSGMRVSLEDFYQMVQSGATQELKIILRTDVQGSMEALQENLTKLKHPEIKLKVIHSAVGNIPESDVNLAIASNAVVVGFNVGIDPKASAMAEQEGVDVRRYSVIYEVVDDLRKAMEGLLEPKKVAKLVGKADVRQVFKVSKVGTVAGVMVTSGHILRSHEVHVIRGTETVFEGKLSSLKHFKDDVKEVKQGLECGVAVGGFEDIEVGDQLEFYEYETVHETITLSV